MAQNSWPFHGISDGTPVLEDEWSIMARQWAATGVVGYPGDDQLQVSGNGSGREVHVATGRANVRGHWYELDAEATLAIAANTSGNPRIDQVVLSLDPSADEMVLAVVEGTPAVSPAAPTLTQTDLGVYEFPLAQVSVASGAATITAGNVSDRRDYASVPVTPCTSARRPANPRVGQMAYESDTGLTITWTGADWTHPARIQSGEEASITPHFGVTTVVTFDTAFSTTPNVVLTQTSGGDVPYVSAVDASSFSVVRVGACGFQWIAVGI